MYNSIVLIKPVRLSFLFVYARWEKIVAFTKFSVELSESYL